ncbi:MAG: response regulator [Ignavibacteria bacterium]|nr:response regulator [Ignavibacteria bacterium]HCN38089.1 two-component system response regulator [Bacteroidota bacterium]
MSKKVLIVDDQPEVRELVTVSLQIGEYDVKQAINGDEAINIAKEFMPDLMLLDINMPNGTLDGFEVCKLIKMNPETKNIKIVMLSSKNQPEDFEKGKNAGCNGYLTKPFSPFELMDEVEKFLNS